MTLSSAGYPLLRVCVPCRLGVSGIYKQYNFNDGYYERPPYNADDLRSVFHCRAFDYFKLNHVRRRRKH